MSDFKDSPMRGRTLRLNLSNGWSRIEDLTADFEDYMGHYAMKILYEECPDWVTPFDPRNKIILSCGPLLGTLAPGACKMSISTIGPVTNGWATGSSDSHVGLEMKAAGFDNLIIEGKSRELGYLYLTEDGVEIRDAAFLKGKTTWETLEALREEFHDPELHILSIGPAGEYLSRNACVIQDKNRAFGRCGTGAVFGSKNVKAIVCKGNQPVQVADPERFFKCVESIRKRIKASPVSRTMGKYGTLSAFPRKQEICGIPYKNFQYCKMPDEVEPHMNPMDLIDKYQISRQGFPGCVLCCGREICISEGKYKGFKTNMNQWEIMGAIMGKLCVHNLDFMPVINTRCNQLGIDVDVVGGAIGWAMECYDRGILTKEDTGGLEIKWGDEEMILKLADMMAYREGFGDLLAEGSARAAELFGHDTDYYAINVKKQDLYELLRSSNGWALGTLTSTRGGGHTTGTPTCEQSSTEMSDETTMRVMGVTAQQALDPEEYEGKAKVVYYHEILHRMCNSLGICLFNTVHWDIEFTNVEDLAELTSAALGREITPQMMEDAAMRQLNIEKALNLRYTNFDRKDDCPPPREMEEVPTGSRKGWKIDPDKYNHMLDEYYAMHGWDPKTSYPTRAVYEKYGLGKIADDMEKIGKLGAPQES